MSNFKGTIEVSGWENVKRSALVTIHKKWTGKEITSEWKENILLSRHSPIRQLRIEVYYEEIPRWIADQLVRHTVGVDNYMGTMRTDRGNKDRSEQRMTDVTEFLQVYNGESFIKAASTRMCLGCVSSETREYLEAVVGALKEIEPELALMCTPPCIERLGCKEIGFTKCNHLDRFFGYCDLHCDPTTLRYDHILGRYRAYQAFREDE